MSLDKTFFVLIEKGSYIYNAIDVCGVRDVMLIDILIDILLLIVCQSTNDYHLHFKGKIMTDFKFISFWNKPRGENYHFVDESVHIIVIRQKTFKGFRV